MLQVASKDIEKLHKFLTDLSPRALPHAAKDALNTSAFALRREWANEGKRTMTVRNKWTFGGRHHRVVKAKAANNILAMEAIAGNTHKYMREQEHGVIRRGGFLGSVPIPGIKSRVGASSKRLQRPSYWRRKIGLVERLKRSQFTSKKQYMAANIAKAKRRGKKFVYLDLESWGRGIFDIRTKTKMKKVWNLNRRVTKTRSNPMMKRALHTLKPAFPQYHKSALEGQILFVLRKRGLRAGSAGSVIKRVLAAFD